MEQEEKHRKQQVRINMLFIAPKIRTTSKN